MAPGPLGGLSGAEACLLLLLPGAAPPTVRLIGGGAHAIQREMPKGLRRHGARTCERSPGAGARVCQSGTIPIPARLLVWG